MKWETLWIAFGALAAALAAYVAWGALATARRGIDLAHATLIEAQRARRVTLAISLSERFSSDEMHAALSYLGQRHRETDQNARSMAAAYVKEVLEAPVGTLTEWNRCRRKVSKFFMTAHALWKAELLEPAVLARQLRRPAFELFIYVVAPLDEAHSVQVLGRRDFFDHAVRDDFTKFVESQFGRRRVAA